MNYPITLDEPRPERLVVRDAAKGEWRVEVDLATAAHARIKGHFATPTRSFTGRTKRLFSVRHGRNGLNGQPVNDELAPLPDLPPLWMAVNWVTHTRPRPQPDTIPSPLAPSAS